MKNSRIFAVAAVLSASESLGMAQEAAATLTTIYSFQGHDSGSHPENLIQRANGALYGTTSGVVFELKPPATAGGTWTEKVLHSFGTSAKISGLAIGSDGNVYGTSYSGGTQESLCTGGCGTLFALTPPSAAGTDWNESTIYEFKGAPDGAAPYGNPVVGPNGEIYGTTTRGGAANNCTECGTVFMLAPPSAKGRAWKETVIYSFEGIPSDGSIPFGTLVIGGDGTLYGATESGGRGCAGGGGCGTVFALKPPHTPGGNWTESVLYAFGGYPTDGANPEVGLVLGAYGSLYGTTYNGASVANGCGVFGCGTAFQLTPPSSPGDAWTETVLHTFAGPPDDGESPGPLILGANGSLYGTTSYGGETCNGYRMGCGTVFELLPPASSGGEWTESVMYAFAAGASGVVPWGLVMNGDGVLYGTTTLNRPGGGYGTVFELQP